MATIATDQQVQNYSDQRVRVRSEQIRALYLACKNDKAQFDDIFLALTQPSPTWTDKRTDGPPHLLVPNDILAWNTFITGIIALVESGSVTDMQNAGAQYPIILDACVRSV